MYLFFSCFPLLDDGCGARPNPFDGLFSHRALLFSRSRRSCEENSIEVSEIGVHISLLRW